MVDEHRLEIQYAQPRDVAILARDLGEIFQRIVIERPERPSFEPFGGPRGKFVANRSPHRMMLCRRSHCVNAPRAGALRFLSRGAPGFRNPRACKPQSPFEIHPVSTTLKATLAS